MAFHHTLAQLLYILPIWRRSIQAAVAFLKTIVNKPDEYNWLNLKSCLKYLKDTKHMKLFISVDLLSIVKLWVYASYITNGDCKGHNRSMMTLGEVAVISMYSKQNFNVKGQLKEN